ncbi:MAG: helix-turn-helix domain-containing protein [Bacteroidia bacterium]|nr:helix-turn-helix domain-containing protein [Bacteroidia bacterium]
MIELYMYWIVYDTIMIAAPITHAGLDRRRRDLGLTFAVLSSRSGVPEPTVKRILGGRLGEASFVHVVAIARALGSPISSDPQDVDEMVREQARLKAEGIARVVQGTSALEAQAVDDAEYRRLVERSYHELLAGSRRRLWAD